VINSYNEIARLFRSVKNHASAIIDSFAQADIPCCIIGDGRFFTTQVGSVILGVSCILSQNKVKTKDDIESFISERNKDRDFINPILINDDNIKKLIDLKQVKYYSAIGFIYDVLDKWKLLKQ
jgi:hypothetical protein